MRLTKIVLLAGIAAGFWTVNVQAQARSAQKPADPAAAAKANWQTRTVGTPGPNFGETTQVFYRLGATELDPDSSGTTYTSSWDPGAAQFNYLRYVTGGFPHLIGWAHLPGGSLVPTYKISYCDTTAGPPHMTINLYNCTQFGVCDTSPLITYDTGTFGSGCFEVTFLSGLGSYTVNNDTNQLMVDVIFGTPGDTQQIASVAFGYVMQVSPAPGTPTFTDVPISDGAFQFIEAFAAANITVGCQAMGDPPKYCPDDFVTRRQMAVFFAKALGLNWSQ